VKKEALKSTYKEIEGELLELFDKSNLLK